MTAAARPLVQIEGVTKRFDPAGRPAVNDVSLEIQSGEFFALLGDSGSGKSTLLRLLAGFERPDQGRILIDGVDMADFPPYARPVNMMFQSYALFPHMTVAANIAFGLKQDKLPRAEIARRVEEGLALVQLGDFAERKPHQLSGGQRQRVALARCLVKRPKLLLLDEPLGALDKQLRERTQFELVGLQDRLGLTFVMVTHDQEEAMTMACRMAVMREGQIAQIGPPAEIYEAPASRVVAAFVGSVNIFEGTVTGRAAADALIDSPGLGLLRVEAETNTVSPIWVAVRPEKIRVSREEPDQTFNKAQGVIADIGYLGGLSIFHVKLPDGRMLRATAPNLDRRADGGFSWDDAVWLSWPARAGVILTQ
jgi:putrescine transport system ATP-binding protein